MQERLETLLSMPPSGIYTARLRSGNAVTTAELLKLD